MNDQIKPGRKPSWRNLQNGSSSKTRRLAWTLALAGLSYGGVPKSWRPPSERQKPNRAMANSAERDASP
jgi:hypothetical protein